jgi:SAP domain
MGYVHDDIKQMKHATTKPKEFQQSNAAYMMFPPHIFRKHIYQEEYAQVGRSYWMNKKKEKAEQEKKAKTKAAEYANKDVLFRKTVDQLKDDLRKYGLPVSGKKAQLVGRVRSHLDSLSQP